MTMTSADSVRSARPPDQAVGGSRGWDCGPIPSWAGRGLLIIGTERQRMTRKANPGSLGTASGQRCSISGGGLLVRFHRFLLVVTPPARRMARTSGGLVTQHPLVEGNGRR